MTFAATRAPSGVADDRYVHPNRLLRVSERHGKYSRLLLGSPPKRPYRPLNATVKSEHSFIQHFTAEPSYKFGPVQSSKTSPD